MSGSLDVILNLDGTEETLERFPPLPHEVEGSVSILFRIGDSTVSLTFPVSGFVAFARRLSGYADKVPGRPS